jgi:putative Ca2+/H+ antiporter (TMEM165/GDT1 family)
MTAFWLAFVLVFVAEMGDKTQFMTLTFSTRYPPRIVLTGVVAATLLINLVSVIVGAVLGKALPLFWINLTAGLAFIGFGLWSLRSEPEPGDKAEDLGRLARGLGAVVTVGVAFFLAEFGDRTMLATMVIAGREQSFMGVWIGSSAGLISANMLAIVVGKMVGRRLPAKSLKYVTAIVFVASGLFALVAACRA